MNEWLTGSLYLFSDAMDTLFWPEFGPEKMLNPYRGSGYYRF